MLASVQYVSIPIVYTILYGLGSVYILYCIRMVMYCTNGTSLGRGGGGGGGGDLHERGATNNNTIQLRQFQLRHKLASRRRSLHADVEKKRRRY